jgi:hypothetical protein
VINARNVSVTLGVISAVSTFVVAWGYVVRWFTQSRFREPPSSQPEYAFLTVVLAALAVLEAVLALRASDNVRVVGMPAVTGIITVAGFGATINFDELGYWLLYTGGIGLLAALVAAAEAPRRIIAAIIGFIAAVALAVVLGLVQRMLR